MRSAKRAARQLPGRGATGVDDAPAPGVNQKSDHDIMGSLCRTRIYRISVFVTITSPYLRSHLY